MIVRLKREYPGWGAPKIREEFRPDVGLQLPPLLHDCGYVVRETRPLVFIVSPRDVIWQWPSTFLRSGAMRLRDLGYLAQPNVDAILAALDDAERDPLTLMMTPLVLEIIASKSA